MLKPKIERLGNRLKDDDFRMRAMAAYDLRDIEVKKAVHLLIKALRDPHWIVRTNADGSMMKNHNPRAVVPLITL